MMSKYRNNLPQLGDDLFITDGGLETILVFHDKIDLPYFASFHMLRSPEGIDHLLAYFRQYAALARDSGKGLVLESVTWRANSDWGTLMGLTKEEMETINLLAIKLLADVRREMEVPEAPIVVSGCVGPRGDGYVADGAMTAEEAQAYHSVQISTFARSEADMVGALTMTNIPEAVGITRAAQAAGIPVAISFTLETDGKLPSGDSLKTAIEETDRLTGKGPAYYMINCAHPTHFEAVLKTDEPWVKRLRGLRANASKRSHAELDESPELDVGNPAELGLENAALKRRLPHLTVFGGCCGTDHRHISEICTALDRTAAE
jgi:S-methylmethionine-dependent homocysteine/selenocysteine methylase